jgi:hypothetical protein
MRKNLNLLGLLTMAIVAGVLFTGCFSLPQSPSEALDAIGVNRAQELQYYLKGGNIVLTLAHTRNSQLDSGAKVSKGEVSYTREQIIIPITTKGVAVQQKTAEDGTPMIGIAFEDDTSKLIWFIQDTKELHLLSEFVLATGDSSMISYDNAYYFVGGRAMGSTSLLAASASSGVPTLGIYESVKTNSRTVKGKALR